jgi:histidine triad (HIT) family protein
MMASDCLFCRIASGEIPSTKVTETETMLAFRDIDPKAPTHILVIPRSHLASLAEAGDSAMLGELLAFAASVARSEGLERNGYRVVTNVGRDGGQSVDHLHLHVMGGRPMSWPPG